MMNHLMKVSMVIAVLATAVATADDLLSGIPVGKPMLSMPIEKLGGLDDGVPVGDTICYT